MDTLAAALAAFAEQRSAIIAAKVHELGRAAPLVFKPLPSGLVSNTKA